MAGQPASIHADQSAADTTTAATDAETSLPPASCGSPSEPAGGPDSGSAVQPQPHVLAPAAQQHPASDEGQPPAEQPAAGDPADQPKRDQAEASLGAAPPAMPPGHRSLAELGARLLFEKVMTTWDMSGHGRIVVPKMAAATSMPQLEERNGFSLDIDAVDTCGARHPLTFRSQATGGRDRVWQLEGLREVQAKYGIALGNILVVSQLPDGTMCLSGRPGRPTDAARKPPRKSQRAEKKRKVYDAWAAADASSSDTEVTEGSFFEPLRDGVYRAVPGGPRGAKARSGPPRVTEMYGTWTAVIDLAGEAYQAFFRNADSARESYNAATQHLNLTPSQHATP